MIHLPKNTLVALALIIGTGHIEESFGQQTARLTQAVTNLDEANTFKIASDDMNLLNRMSFGFVTEGIVTITSDRASLVCYRPDGSIVWKKSPPEKVISAIHVSDNGKFISAYYPLEEEGRGMTEILSSNGDPVWRKQYNIAFLLSKTGKYLFSGADVMEVPPLMVIDTATGNVLWKRRSDEFQARLLDDETIIHVIRGEVSMIEMDTGKVIAKRDLREYFEDDLPYTDWEISVSQDGKYFTILARSEKSQKKLIQTYNSRFQVVWTKLIESGGAAQIVGLSEDGSKLCVTQGYQTSLYDNLSGNLLWRVKDRILNNGGVVSNDFIAMTQVGYQSEIFVMAKDGSLANRFKTNSIFMTTKLPQVASKRDPSNLSTPSSLKTSSIVEIREEGDQHVVTFYKENRS